MQTKLSFGWGIFLFSLLSSLLNWTAHAAPSEHDGRSDHDAWLRQENSKEAPAFCARLLTAVEDFKNRDEIYDAIQKQTAHLAKNPPALLDRDGNPSVDLLEYMNRGVARLRLEATRNLVVQRFNEAEIKFRAALRKKIHEEYHLLNLLNVSKINEAKDRARKGLAPLDSLKPIGYSRNPDGTFDTAIGKRYRAIALALLKENPEKLQKVGAADFDVRIMESLVHALKQKYFEPFQKTDAPELINSAENAMHHCKLKQSPDWECVLKASRQPLEKLIAEVAAAFELNPAQTSLLSQELLRPFDLNKIPTAAVNPETGLPEIMIPEIHTKKHYNQSLATQELLPHGKENSRDAPAFEIWHGEGTIHSGVDSNKFLISKLLASGFNPSAINLPNAGPTALQLKGVKKIVTYLDERVRALNNANHDRALIVNGRSMGASKLYALGLLFPQSEIDAKVMVSLSIPTTEKEQMIFIQKQIDAGTYPPHFPEELQNASSFNVELLEFLEKVKREDPHFFDLFADDQLWLQGDNDEDGGERVIENLYDFQNHYGKLAHIYVFHDRLKGAKTFREVPPEDREGTHFILNPKLSDQYIEALGAVYGQMDYLIEEGLAKPRLVKLRPPGKTLLQTFAESQGVTESHRVDGSEDSPDRILRWAFRLDRVRRFWEAEKVRCRTLKRIEAKGRF